MQNVSISPSPLLLDCLKELELSSFVVSKVPPIDWVPKCSRLFHSVGPYLGVENFNLIYQVDLFVFHEQLFEWTVFSPWQEAKMHNRLLQDRNQCICPHELDS